MKFDLIAKVRRECLDTITLRVDADNEFEALATADIVLEKFPDAHQEVGVEYCYIEDRTQLEADVLSVELDEEMGIG